MKQKKLSSLENTAPLIATSVAFSLALLKFSIWILSWSVALLSSAIDSLLDTGVSIFNYFAIKFSKEPADSEHNYWHWKAQAIAVALEWLVITISWLYIIYLWIHKIFSPQPIEYIHWTLVVMWISILFTGLLVSYLNSVYKKTKNLVIQWDSLHYKMDLISNIAVLLVLWFLYFFPTLSWVDWIIGIFIGIYIIHEAYELIAKWINILLDKVLDEHWKIENILQVYQEKGTIDWYHAIKTRQWGNHDKFVEFHFQMPPKTTIKKAHLVGDDIKADIKKLDPNSFWHAVWHVDYRDDS